MADDDAERVVGVSAAALAFAADHGLFVEPINASPWAYQADQEDAEPRAAGEAFWAEVKVAAGGRVT